MSVDNNSRSHMIQIDETQIDALILSINNMQEGPSNVLVEIMLIRDMLQDLKNIPEAEYKRDMLHGFTL